ncbi:MAG: diguanylate cyclase [Leptolyngbya sp. SIO1E4]|nr:diguanylate cyclase [Leptolyngbya sp. SIO1E4]
MANILIADDDALARTILNLAMQQEGHQVTQAETGQECLELAQKQTQDMIFLDAKMPNMDGFTCCAELKALLQDQCPPVVMITGLSDQESVDRAFSVGAIDYVTKPIHMAVLRHRMRQVLRERELMHQLGAINQQLATANKELQQLARLDGLTRLANRRYFEELLSKEWRRLARQQQPLGVIFCDVDFFKQYNDLYGHLAGDFCLQDISQLLQLSIMRPADLVARYGGEEFVILLPETDGTGTEHVAKRIHTKLSNAAIPHKGSQIASIVTLSMGATCTLPNLTTDPKDVLEVADRALYNAKSQGRNQTVLTPYQQA